MALSPEKLASAQTPEQMAISGVNGTPTNQSITPSSLSSAQPIQPAITPTYTPPTLAPLPTPNVALTAQEQGALDQVSPYQQLIDQLSGQTSELAQKSFRNQQSQALGLNQAQNLSQSLYDKQQSLDLRSQAIEAQRQQAIAEKVQSMTGQGIASGIVNRRSAIDTQFNQQALTNTLAKLDNAVSYYASTGKVREAQQAVDQAVDAEFTPKLIALDTAQRNLASLLQSPDLTSAQQKKALNLQAQYTAQENAIKEAAQVKKDTGDARIKALTNNPNMPQNAHDAISLAQSPEEVAALVNYFKLSSISKAEQLDQTYKQAQIDKMNYDLAHPNVPSQVIEANNGHTLLINTATGATIKDYGVKKAVVDTSAPTVKTINGVDKQWNPTTQKWEDVGGGITTPEQTQKSKDQIDLVLSSLDSAEKLAGASGRSGVRKFVEGALVGSTDYTNLVAETNTLRTNVLTMMTDPAIKKFFGPQMSNADVQLMTSAGTTLNPELQSPEKMKAELARLKDFALRAKQAVSKGEANSGESVNDPLGIL